MNLVLQGPNRHHGVYRGRRSTAHQRQFFLEYQLVQRGRMSFEELYQFHKLICEVLQTNRDGKEGYGGSLWNRMPETIQIISGALVSTLIC